MPRDRQIFCAAMLTPSVKVGNELEFGDLLDGHPGGHAGRDRLHGLG
jgi:hypothetical protein